MEKKTLEELLREQAAAEAAAAQAQAEGKEDAGVSEEAPGASADRTGAGEAPGSGEKAGSSVEGREEAGSAADPEKPGAENCQGQGCGPEGSVSEDSGSEDTASDNSASEDSASEDSGAGDPGSDDSEEGSESGEADAGTAQAEGADDGKEKKGFFKRNKGDKEKKALQEKVEALEDRVKRQMAEFENFRRRTEKEKQQMFSMGERNVIEKMLPIVDNFERGLAAVPEEEKEGALASGMEMVYRQLLKQLEDLGVAPIEAVGQEFNPDFHNAVMQVASEEYPSGTVAQEFQKGYKYHDQVIRYSMVGVVQ